MSGRLQNLELYYIGGGQNHPSSPFTSDRPKTRPDGDSVWLNQVAGMVERLEVMETVGVDVWRWRWIKVEVESGGKSMDLAYKGKNGWWVGESGRGGAQRWQPHLQNSNPNKKRDGEEVEKRNEIKEKWRIYLVEAKKGSRNPRKRTRTLEREAPRAPSQIRF